MSCQDICVVMDYDGYNDFSRSKMRRAAKPHACCECYDVIRVGDSHEYVAGKSEGDFWDARTCAPCAEIRKAFVCDSWVISTLWEEIRDQMFPKWDAMTAIDCLAKLTTQAAIDKARAKYADYVEAQS